MGYQVKLYEADRVAGGVLSFGIPAYRLPQDVLARELALIERMGVEFSYGHRVGHDLTLNDLQSAGFGAVFLGIGLGLSARVGLPGEDLEGVFWAADLLREIKANPQEHSNLLNRLGHRVAVIGGGNVAVDVACSMHRLGIQKVELVCLEGPQEMPAFPSEVRFAMDEGVELHTRCQPVSILGDDQGHVAGLEGVGIEWKKPGLFIPDNAVPVPGTEFRLQTDSVVEAIGQRPDAAVLEAFQLEISSTGLVAIDEETGQTSNPMVFAAGDVANGGATVVQAVAEGKKAAQGIHRFLQKRT
jgi:NADPH-dependent glutamate synthase beta subunit-like oxidoreductase